MDREGRANIGWLFSEEVTKGLSGEINFKVTLE